MLQKLGGAFKDAGLCVQWVYDHCAVSHKLRATFFLECFVQSGLNTTQAVLHKLTPGSFMNTGLCAHWTYHRSAVSLILTLASSSDALR